MTRTLQGLCGLLLIGFGSCDVPGMLTFKNKLATAASYREYRKYAPEVAHSTLEAPAGETSGIWFGLGWNRTEANIRAYCSGIARVEIQSGSGVQVIADSAALYRFFKKRRFGIPFHNDVIIVVR